MQPLPPSSRKKLPPLFQQPPSQSWGPVKPSLFENLVGGSTCPSPPSRRGGAHFESCQHRQLGRFLKDGPEILSKPISEISNLLISHGIFMELKPNFRKAIKVDPSNYRPMLLWPLISKIIEKVVHDQTNELFSDNKILYNCQSGFRNNHSTNLCLSFLTDKVLKGFDEGLLNGMMLIDLQKAFDTLNHEILLKNLEL